MENQKLLEPLAGIAYIVACHQCYSCDLRWEMSEIIAWAHEL